MSLDLLLRILPYWFQAFAFTLVVEIPLFIAVARLGRGAGGGPRAPVWRLALAGAAGTCLTHPLLWFAWPLVVHDYALYIASGEILIAVIESATFFALARPIPLPRAIAASFVANGASYGLGILLRAWGVMG
jgi:hypothetical protein